MKRTEKPIIFSGPMVRAILAGNKTQTRRVIRFPKGLSPHWYHGPTDDGLHDFMFGAIDQANRMAIDWSEFVKAPYAPGDILWVREKWRTVDYEYCGSRWSAAVEYADGSRGHRVFWYDNTDVGILYDGPYSKTGWRPSIHMPKEAARLFLRVTDVRVERVQEITEADAKAEGIRSYWGEPHRDDAPFIGAAKELGADLCFTRAEAFSQLWNHLHAKRGYGWDDNPWVWVYSFERVDKPAGWPGGEEA